MKVKNQKAVSEKHVNHPSHNSASSQESQTQSLIFNLFSSLIIGLLALFLPRQYVGGNIVLTFIFPKYRSSYYALVIAIMLSFAGAISGLLIGNSSRHATIRRFYFRISMVSMASIFSILPCALLLAMFRLLVSSVFKLWLLHEDGADSSFFCRFTSQAGFFRSQVDGE